MGHREREREALCFSRHILITVSMLILAVCCPACGGTGYDQPAKDSGSIEPGTGSSPEIATGGEMLDGGGSGQAGPIGDPQSLADWSQTAINAWGPVIQTHYVSTGQGGLTVPVKQLYSPDPFTATYQMEDGSIVVSNRPLGEIVSAQCLEDLPPTVGWNGPNGLVQMFENEILVNFTTAAAQLDIELLISQYNLYVIMSWFEPSGVPGQGNSIASFQFEYDDAVFPTFDDAYAFFNSQPLVIVAGPNTADQVEDHYDPPNDPIYTGWIEPDLTSYNPLARIVNVLGTDNTPLVPAGPETEEGEWFSDQVVAVVDDGVYRNHPDYAFL
ncbi:hypothetical protein JW859_08465 [bacterium]|nr:hypothetical protein [bacterium]